MASECKECGKSEDYNYSINTGLCNVCIGYELDRIENLEERIEALEQLLACYRVGNNPSETLYRKLDKTKKALEGK